jgi:hypothetical protein
MLLEKMKFCKHLRFVSQEKNLSEFREIINKAYIVAIPAHIIWSRAPHIQKTSSRRALNTLRDMRKGTVDDS